MTNNYKVSVTNKQELLREKIRQKEIFDAECVNVDTITTDHEVTDIACANVDTNRMGIQKRIGLTKCLEDSTMPSSNLKTTGLNDDTVLMMCSKETNINPELALVATSNQTLLCEDIPVMRSKEFCPLDLLSSDDSDCETQNQIAKSISPLKIFVPIHTNSLMHAPSFYMHEITSNKPRTSSNHYCHIE